MLKVLLVDDEPIITIGLKKLIDWKELGLVIIGEARDGEEALILTETLRPDIIITDLLMAGMDGITFIKTMKETEYGSRIIILSGHSEFEYAKEALKNNVFEYLLKPVSAMQLKETLLQARKNIENEIKVVKDRQVLEYKVRESMPILRERFIWQLLRDEPMSKKEIKEKSSLFEMPLNGDGYNVISVALENSSEVEGFQDEKGQVLLRFSTLNVATEVTRYFAVGYHVIQNNTMYMIILSSKGTNDRLPFTIAKSLQRKLEDIFGLIVTIGISNKYEDATSIHQAYLEAKDILKYKFYLKKGAILTLDDINIKKYRRLYSRQCESDILENIRYNIPIDCNKSTQKLVNNFISRAKNNTDLISTYCFEFFIRLRNILEVDEMVKNPLPDVVTLNNRIMSIINIHELEDFVRSTLTECIEAIMEAKKLREIDVVAEAKAYINQHYNEVITLNSISKLVHISSTYFCSLFKNKTGMGFHEYLLKVRMNKAAKYLLSKNYKVYEVANMVGYKNPRYFSEAFKKYYGIIPTEYK